VSAPVRRAIFEADFLEPGTPQRVVVDGLPPLCVVQLPASEGGGVFVVADTCTHGDASLSEGFVEGDAIECPFHAGLFCLRDGRATKEPAVEPIRTWPATVVDGQVCIDVVEP
jgi:nitrite reductase/ring-hydroxylating ferredoxin subunit